VVIALSLATAYTKTVKTYRSDAIVSFNFNYLMDTKDSGFQNKIQALVFSLRYGDNLEAITEKAYPEINPEKQAVLFESKMQRLGSRNGIQLSFRKDNYQALGISFESNDPEEAFRVVEATLNRITEQNAESAKRRFTKSVSFLENEISQYREKLGTIEKELFRLGGETSEVDKDPLLSEVRTSIVEKLQSLQVLTSQGYGAEHPKRKMLSVELQGLRALEQQRLEELSTEINSPQSTPTTQLDSSNPARNARVVELKREREGIMTAYVRTVEELEYTKRRGRVETTDDVGLEIIIEEPPTVPKTPVPFAGLSFILMSGFLSLATGIGLFTLIEMMDSSVHSVTQLESISELPTLGVVEKIREPREARLSLQREIFIGASLLTIVLLSNQIIKIII
jgi:hypothetical protein